MLFDPRKAPGTFPPCLHEVFEKGVGTWTVFTSPNRKKANAMYNQWKAFRLSLPRFPVHPTSQLAAMYNYTAGLRFDGVTWGVEVTLREKSFAESSIEKALGGV